MKRFLVLQVILLLGAFSSWSLPAQDPYQPGCGNDSPENHKCNKQQCPRDDSAGEEEYDADDDPDDSDEDDADDCDDAGANPINPTKANHHREVTDIKTFGPAPITFARNINSRTTDFNDTYWELGARQSWQHNWNYETRQLSSKTFGFFDIKVRYPDGNDYNFKAVDGTGAQLAPAADNGDRLYRWSGATVGYTLLTRDGAEYDFWRYLSPKFKLTQMRNGSGYSWNCTYDSNNRLTRITNNFGRWIQIDRQTGSDGVLRINRVSTSDGRAVNYLYSPWAGTGNYVLTAVTYPGSEQASYTYVTSDPNLATARPLLSSAADPAYGPGKPGAQMKYTYNYNSLSNGSIITGTLLEERSSITDQMVISFPLGSGAYPKVQEGSGALLTRKYSKGLLSVKGDAEGRITTLIRGSDGYGYVVAKTDPQGATTQYQRDYAGRILSRTDALGNTLARTYNGKGFLLTKTDERNHTITWTRDPSNRVSRKDYPDGSYETWTYNSNSQPLTHRLRNGGTGSFAYNSFGDTISKTDALGNTTGLTYFPNGLVASITDAKGNMTALTYNWRGQILTVTHPDASSLSYQYDAFGNRTAVTNELGYSTSYAYDEYNRLKSVTDPLSHTTVYEYGLAPGCSGCSYVSNIARITSPSGRVTAYEYDESRLRTAQTVGAGTPDAATTTYAYDAVKNLTSVTDPNGKTWLSEYDVHGHKVAATDPLGNRTQWTYDERGNKTSETRADGAVTQFQYDSRNRLVQTIDPLNNVSQMTYDNSDNLVSLTDARNNTYTYSYDLLNRKASLTYPDGSHELYAYDSVGNLVGFTTRGGQNKILSYDNRDREIGCTWNDGTSGKTNTYDKAGRVLASVNATGTLGFTYDAANQLLSESQQITDGGGTRTVTYTYDADGNRATIGYPSGLTIALGFNNRQLMKTIVAGDVTAVFTYDANGNPLSKSLSNNTTTDYVYDDANRLLDVNNRGTSSGISRFSYGYNPVGYRLSRQASIGEPPTTDKYDYDPAGQLTSVRYNFNSATNTQERLVGYNHDAAGNRTSVTDNGLTSTYQANALNQYATIGGNSASYDANGNLVSLNGSTYTFDAQNRMTSVVSGGNTVAFSYDARNRCVSRTINGAKTRMYYDDWNLIEERSESDQLLAQYIHGPNVDELIARVTPTSTGYYYLDGLGSVVALADSSGNVLESYRYDVYGLPVIHDGLNAVIPQTLTGNRFLFAGREYIAEISLYDFRSRIYSPVMGRFLQTDSLRLRGGDLNLYRYVGNSPTNATDPFGSSWKDFVEWLKNLMNHLVPGHEFVEGAKTTPFLVLIANEKAAEKTLFDCLDNPPQDDPCCEKAFQAVEDAKSALSDVSE
jgi:RHS repeat-associated protein